MTFPVSLGTLEFVSGTHARNSVYKAVRPVSAGAVRVGSAPYLRGVSQVKSQHRLDSSLPSVPGPSPVLQSLTVVPFPLLWSPVRVAVAGQGSDLSRDAP